MNTFSSSGLIPSTLQGTREADDFGTDMFDKGIGTDLDPIAFEAEDRIESNYLLSNKELEHDTSLKMKSSDVAKWQTSV